MVEVWLPVVGFDGHYEVGGLGHVRGLDRMIMRYRHDPPREMLRRGGLLSPWWAGKPARLQVTLSKDGKKYYRAVHILVLESHVGPRPPEMHGLHRDDDPSNNTPENLYWGTREDNKRDEIRNGRNANVNKNRCPNQHEYTESNTYIQMKNGRQSRQCRECRRLADQKRTNGWQRQRDAAKGEAR